jgi:peptidoglycan hydrolase-like protein with peptidoglycan-binding domain
MNKIIILCLIISFFSTGCDMFYRLVQKEGAEEKELIGEISAIERNPRVEEIQRLLKLYGYNVGTPDGKLGPYTRAAIESFQEDNGLKISRFVDNATWERLNMFGATGLVIDGQLDIQIVQTALKNAGFDPGKIDGKLGPQTDAKIKKFQKAMGLLPDGKIGFRTLRELNDFLPINP